MLGQPGAHLTIRRTTVLNDVVDGPLLDIITFKNHLVLRPEWAAYRHTCESVKQRNLFLRTRVRCREAATCRCTWEATYFSCNFGLPVKTLVVVQHGIHEHTGAVDSGRLFSQAALKIANSFVESCPGHCKMVPALKAFLLQHGISESTLPNDSQMKEWIRRTLKKNKRSEYRKQPDTDILVEPVRQDVGAWRDSFVGELHGERFLLANCFLFCPILFWPIPLLANSSFG